MRGGTEYYFELLDYKTIIISNWELFRPTFEYGKKNSGTKKGTDWLTVLNEKRRVVMHPSAAVMLTLEELAELEDYERWMTAKLAGTAFEESAEQVR